MAAIQAARLGQGNRRGETERICTSAKFQCFIGIDVHKTPAIRAQTARLISKKKKKKKKKKRERNEEEGGDRMVGQEVGECEKGFIVNNMIWEIGIRQKGELDDRVG